MNATIQKPATVIIRGQFSTGKDSKGHFTGWDAEGQQIIIQKKMMKEEFGFDTNAEWTKANEKERVMFDVIYETNKTFLLTNDNGEPLLDDKGVQKSITQEARATAIFKNKPDFIKARLSGRMQQFEVEREFETTVRASNLSEATVNRLLTHSPLG